MDEGEDVGRRRRRRLRRRRMVDYLVNCLTG